ncbi:hypothetical protein JDV02_005977 [Purpureocillium takamizusanense]|uniref:GH16 domain-containing protein n=1 Tax=Purpureocillium takamizusanense TaxID=2060973 RepID=A0A9Q8QIG4_9HYPO|nr:uncharacterized protein JDV02_005977 [Purpureocillium takamizusanense]UNI19827.1 hypothetical protein JDV02_005977 [Purpureocillium takamizusanense]
MLRHAATLFALLRLGSGHAIGASHPHPRAVEGIQGVAIPNGFSHCFFYDDFSQPAGSQPSPSRWAFDLGHGYPGGPENWGTGEVQSYTSDPRNVAVTDRGTLKITPLRGADGTWTSSRIETTERWDIGCRKGDRMRIEARIRLGDDPATKQLGMWPAFWALGSEFRGDYSNWPGVGEIDILESINGENKLWNVVHCGFAPGGPCNEPSGLSHIDQDFRRGVWHTIAWEVDRRHWPLAEDEKQEESMSWFVDGKKQWTLKQSAVKNDTAWEALAGGKKMLLLNVAVGGGFPDAVAGIKTPTNETVGGQGASMEVDYVAAYIKLL